VPLQDVGEAKYFVTHEHKALHTSTVGVLQSNQHAKYNMTVPLRDVGEAKYFVTHEHKAMHTSTVLRTSMVPRHQMHQTAGQVCSSRLKSKISERLAYILTRKHCRGKVQSHHKGFPNIQSTARPVTIHQDVWAAGQQKARDTTAIPNHWFTKWKL